MLFSLWSCFLKNQVISHCKKGIVSWRKEGSSTFIVCLEIPKDQKGKHSPFQFSSVIKGRIFPRQLTKPAFSFILSCHEPPSLTNSQVFSKSTPLLSHAIVLVQAPTWMPQECIQSLLIQCPASHTFYFSLPVTDWSFQSLYILKIQHVTSQVFCNSPKASYLWPIPVLQS